MIHGIILTDNTYNDNDYTVNRASGAHRIAHHLRQHRYNIEVVDYCLRFEYCELEQLLDKLISESTLFIGIGTNLFVDREEFNQSVEKIHQKWPNLPIVLGGANLLARDIPCVTYYLEGYAETAMLELLEVIKGKQDEDNLKFSNFVQDRKLIDANKDYPVKDTSDLSIEYLESDFITPNQTLGLETARGCIFKCSFCTYPLIGKTKADYVREIDNIVDEIKRNYDRYGVTRYVINEDTFNDRIEKLELLESGISKLPFDIQFTTYARLDLIRKKPESIDLLKSMGMRGVHFGIDTFSPTAGKIVGKGMTGERLKEAIIWWKEQMPEVATQCTMILGLPEDNEDYFELNQWFINESNVQFWSWVPLYITDLSKTIHTSEFSRNYAEHGLVYMSDEEIDQALAKEERSGIYAQRWQTYTNKSFRSKMIYWRNTKTGKNYFDMIEIAQQLHAQAPMRRISPWLAFDWASLGYSLDEMYHWGWNQIGPQVPTEDIDNGCAEHIARYKQKKLNFDYQTYYSKQTPQLIPLHELPTRNIA